MALTTCRECGNQISDEAVACPHCGAPSPALSYRPAGKASAAPSKQSGSSGGKLVILGILALILFVVWNDRTESASSDMSTLFAPPAPPPAALYEPVLEIQSWSWSESYSYAIAEGEVKNISGGSLDNVQAQISYYDKTENFITSDDALIDYRPILPGQTSPFKVMTTWNPAMHNARLEFKTFSGERLISKTKEKTTKP